MPYDVLREIMPHYDIFLLPSKTARDGDEEGMSLALLEAQASGIPVVTTDCAGNSEAVCDGVTGFMLPEGDIDGIAIRIEQLINDRPLRQSMGEAARRHIKNHFDIKNILPGWRPFIMSYYSYL